MKPKRFLIDVAFYFIQKVREMKLITKTKMKKREKKKRESIESKQKKLQKVKKFRYFYCKSFCILFALYS